MTLISNKKVFLFIVLSVVAILLSGIAFAQENKFYQLALTYSKGNIKAKDVIVLPGDISKINSGGDYRIELMSFSNTSLYKTNFDIPTSFHGEEFDYTTGKVTGKETTLDTLDLVLNVPYFSNGKKIDVYDPKSVKILTIPVQHFAEITPTPISPTPQYKVTKLEKGIGGTWIIAGGILLFVTIAGGLIYLRFKNRGDLLQ